MNKYIVMIMFVSIILLAVPSAQAVNVDTVPMTLKISEGQEYIVNITINSGDQVVYAAQYDLVFDHAVLEAESQVRGTFLGQDGANTLVMVNTLDNDAGKTLYGETRMGTSEGVIGNGILASVKFRALSSVEEPVSFVLQNVVLADNISKKINDIVVNGNSLEIKETATASTISNSSDSSSASMEEVIAPDLLALINRSNPDDRIAVIASVEPSSIFAVVEYLESKGPDVSDIEELKLADAVAFKSNSSVIVEMSTIPYVKRIELDSRMHILEDGTETEVNSGQTAAASTKEDEAREKATEQSPGFSFVFSAFLILIVWIIWKDNK